MWHDSELTNQVSTRRSGWHWLLVLALAMIAGACGSSPGATEGGLSVDEVVPASAPDTENNEPVEEPAAEETTAATSTAQTSTADGSAAKTTAAAPAGQAPPPPIEPVQYDGSFASSIEPILAEKCASCHHDGGPGAFHWNLRTAQDAVDTHLLVDAVVSSGAMPPWPASDLSVSFTGDRSLRPDQVQAITDWVADGAPIDVDPVTPVEATNEIDQLTDPDLIVEPRAPYAGDLTKRDDHRCQVYDPKMDDGGWITAYEFRPDQKDVVHHAVGFIMPGAERARIDALDGKDGRPGWWCPNMTGINAIPFSTWTPGQDAAILREGTGIQLPPGGFIVMQIHYHYDGDAPEDNSSFALDIEPHNSDLLALRFGQIFGPVEIPCAEWESGPLCDREAALTDAIARFGPNGVVNDEANWLCDVTPDDFAHFTQGVAESTCTMSAGLTGLYGEVEDVLMHMHEIGSWTRLTINQGEPDELILVDIPTWDFDWQYSYTPSERIVIEPGDRLTLECGWDRSLRDPDLEPAWVVWAEGTNDEMCIAVFTLGALK